jgi:hypothetical protein
MTSTPAPDPPERRPARFSGCAGKTCWGARRPYDLRHAALSAWLKATADALQVADGAGHSVAVLLRV